MKNGAQSSLITTYGMISLREANEGNDMKTLFITFDFHILP